MLKVIKRWFSFSLPIGVQTASSSIPLCLKLKPLHPDMTFVRVNRDDYMALAQTWNIFGIPSFVVTQKGQELGRLVNKARKTKERNHCLFVGDLKDENQSLS